jgi:hypothetical protein
MSFLTKCPNCRSKFSLPEKYRDAPFKCHECAEQFIVCEGRGQRFTDASTEPIARSRSGRRQANRDDGQAAGVTPARPNRRAIVLPIVIVAVVGVVIASVLLISSLGRPSAPDVTISADALWSEYKKSRTAADSKYSSKYLEISGVTGTVEMDDLDRYFIGALRVRPIKPKHQAPGFEAIGDSWKRIAATAMLGEEPAIRLYIRDEDRAQFNRLDSKRPFTVRGRCKGARIDPDAYPEYFVAVYDCVFVGQSEITDRAAGKADPPKGRQPDPRPQPGPGPPPH